MSAVLFDHDGVRYNPTSLTAGPWDPGHAHGGAVAALLAHLTDEVASPEPMLPVRLTVELLRPVRRGDPLRADHRVRRQGRRIQLIEVSLTDSGAQEVALATLLRIRRGTPNEHLEAALEHSPAPQEPTTTPEADELPRYTGEALWPNGFHEAVDLRVASGVLGRPGAAVAWIDLIAEVIDGAQATPLVRAAAAADFGNGLSAPLPMDQFVFINPDLTVQLDRLPNGRWIGIDARSNARLVGIGRTATLLSDRDGPVGIALQSLLVE